MTEPEYPIDITPSVADVAALLRARTKDVNGNEVGTFNDDTRPTSLQVITLIDEADVHHVPAHDAAERLTAVVALAVHPDVHRTAVMHPN